MDDYTLSFTPFSDKYMDIYGAKITQKKIRKGTVQYEVVWRSNGKRFTNWIPCDRIKNTKVALFYEKKARLERENNRERFRKPRITIPSKCSPDSPSTLKDETPAKMCLLSDSPKKQGDGDILMVVNCNRIGSPLTPTSTQHSVRVTRTTNKGRSSTSVLDNRYQYYDDNDEDDLPNDADEPIAESASIRDKMKDETNKSDKVVVKTPSPKTSKQKLKSTTPKNKKSDDDDEFNIKNPSGRKKSVTPSPDSLSDFYISQQVSNPSSQGSKSNARRTSQGSFRPSISSPSPFVFQGTSQNIADLKKAGFKPVEIMKNELSSTSGSMCLVRFTDNIRLLPKSLLLQHFPDEYARLIDTKNSAQEAVEMKEPSDLEVPSLSSPFNQSSTGSSSPFAIVDDSLASQDESQLMCTEEMPDSDDFELLISPRSSQSSSITALFR